MANVQIQSVNVFLFKIRRPSTVALRSRARRFPGWLAAVSEKKFIKIKPNKTKKNNLQVDQTAFVFFLFVCLFCPSCS